MSIETTLKAIETTFRLKGLNIGPDELERVAWHLRDFDAEEIQNALAKLDLVDCTRNQILPRLVEFCGGKPRTDEQQAVLAFADCVRVIQTARGEFDLPERTRRVLDRMPAFKICKRENTPEDWERYHRTRFLELWLAAESKPRGPIGIPGATVRRVPNDPTPEEVHRKRLEATKALLASEQADGKKTHDAQS